MTIDKKLYGYIEHELYHYKQYKYELSLERERIIEASANIINGMPRGNGISDTTFSKALQLSESTCILHMERTLRAIDQAMTRLTELHNKVLEHYYFRGRSDKYALCGELGISYETFKRYKKKIILTVGTELGIVNINNL